MENGWIKLHRQLKNKGYWKKSAYVHLWVHLLLSVNHKPKEFMWNGQIIMVKEGQMITGRKQLSEETGISQTSIERILKMLENEHQIGQQKTTKYRLITIVNWGSHQKVDSTLDNKRTTSGQQADTNKNVKNVKNVKKDKNVKKGTIGEPISQEIPDLIKLFEEVNPTCKTYYGNTTQRKACQFLFETYGFEKVARVIKEVLPKTNGKEFFPTITTPVQLKDKWSQLEANYRSYISKQKLKKEKQGNVYW